MENLSREQADEVKAAFQAQELHDNVRIEMVGVIRPRPQSLSHAGEVIVERDDIMQTPEFEKVLREVLGTE